MGHIVDNRSHILEHALHLFATHGYDAIGVREICEAAGVTKPTLYHYFGNKRGVLETLLQERCAPLIEGLSAAAAYTGDLPLSLQRVVSTYFQFAAHEPTLARLLLALWFTVPENEAFQVAAALNEQQQRTIETMFRQAADNHGNMRGRQRTYAATLLGMIGTMIRLALRDNLDLDENQVYRTVQQFSHGIYS
jgi:TetR/AcrR family transcriptional regulator